MVETSFLSVGEKIYKEAKGRGQNDPPGNGSKLETSVKIHIRHNIDTDGYTKKYL